MWSSWSSNKLLHSSASFKQVSLTYEQVISRTTFAFHPDELSTLYNKPYDKSCTWTINTVTIDMTYTIKQDARLITYSDLVGVCTYPTLRLPYMPDSPLNYLLPGSKQIIPTALKAKKKPDIACDICLGMICAASYYLLTLCEQILAIHSMSSCNKLRALKQFGAIS